MYDLTLSTIISEWTVQMNSCVRNNNIAGSPHNLNVTECQEICTTTDGCLSIDYTKLEGVDQHSCYLNHADSSMVAVATDCSSQYYERKGIS